MSAFIVLRRNQAATPNTATSIDPKGLTLVGEFEGTTGRQAIAKAAQKIGTDSHGATLVAVPKKNWTELTVAVETNPRFSFGEPA